MADAITIKALQDASLDAKSLEEVVNGNEVKQVTTRLGESYPSVKKAINTMFENGGLPATPFATKALMTASALVDGKYAQVTDDTVNNGLYVKTAGAWIKSDYDVVSQKRLADELDARAELGSSSNILELEDVVGKLILFMQNNGEIHIPNLSKSVQKALKDLAVDVADIDTRVVYDDASSLFKIYDSNNKLIVSITNRGALIINDVVTSGGSVDNRLSNLESNAVSDTNTEILKATDRAIATRDNDSRLDNVNITSATKLGVSQVMAPSLVRITKNKFFLVISAGGSGDFAVKSAIGYFITVNVDYTLTISEPITVASMGADDKGEYAATGGAALYVNKGAHAGRIYVYFIKRYSTEADVMCHVYSDDMGVTWSSVVDMTQFIPLAESWRITLASPAKMIQIQSGTYEGRIILPCWHGDTNYPDSQAGLKAFIMYSDDGGETYTIGAESANVGSNESAVAEFDGDKLMFLTRNGSSSKATEVSYDGGVTLQDLRILDEVETTKVQSGFVQASNRFDLSTPKLIISTPTGNGRMDLGLYISYDNKTFSMFSQIQTGVAAYSDLEIIDESNILVIYAGGVYKTIDAVIVNLKQLMLGA